VQRARLHVRDHRPRQLAADQRLRAFSADPLDRKLLAPLRT